MKPRIYGSIDRFVSVLGEQGFFLIRSIMENASPCVCHNGRVYYLQYLSVDTESQDKFSVSMDFRTVDNPFYMIRDVKALCSK